MCNWGLIAKVQSRKEILKTSISTLNRLGKGAPFVSKGYNNKVYYLSNVEL